MNWGSALGESRSCHLADKRITVKHGGKRNSKGGGKSCQKTVISKCILFSSLTGLKFDPGPATAQPKPFPLCPSVKGELKNHPGEKGCWE